MEKIIDIVAIIVYVAAGFPIFKEALNNIRHGEIFDENFLMCVASLGSAIMGEFTEAAMVMVLYRIGEYLQDRAVGKSRKAITDLLNICPEFAFVEKDGQIVQVDVDEIDAGDIIVVKPGDRIPADGVVVNGSSRIDTAAITGEALPKNAGEGSQVYSGTINLDGLLKIKLSAKAEESTAARIIELVEDAAANRAKSEKFITKFAKVYTPVVCGVALAVSVLPPLLFKGLWTEWIYRGLCFLVVSCPCALVISIPLGFFAGIGAASSRGILIKGSNYLEALSKTDIMVFDKTGTLTKGVFKVVAVHPHELEKERLLELATLAESFSNHPIARSLADEYGKFVDKSRVSEFKEFAGKGVSAVVDGLKINAGNAKLMESLGIEYHDCEIPGTIVHVALDKKYVGHITISDEIKDDAKATIDGLRNMGLSKLVMLTGDKETIAKHVAQALDVDEFHGDLMPEDKLKIAGDFKTQLASGKVLAFVGDGINDAPVLTKADLGIAMGGMGSAAAVEAADIVLMNDKPSDLLIALSIAQKSMKIIYENIYGAIGIKVAVLILTILGISNMWLALFADVGVCLLAILNSMRALRVNK